MKELCIFKKCVKNKWTVDIFPNNNNNNNNNRIMTTALHLPINCLIKYKISSSNVKLSLKKRNLFNKSNYIFWQSEGPMQEVVLK